MTSVEVKSFAPELSAGALEIDRSGDGEICTEDSVSGWNNWAAIQHVQFKWGGLPPLHFMAALVPRSRTSLTRFHGVLVRGSL